jgi:DNA-binding transcriptional MerR regulator
LVFYIKISTQNINIAMNTPHTSSPAIYRIGAVSKRCGIPVPTLRVWQTRHNALSPSTTRGQHRLYTEEDVVKATLLKSLTAQGHAISLIAGLTCPQLQQLLASGDGAGHAITRLTGRTATGPLRCGVVGEGLAQRLGSERFQSVGQGVRFKIQKVWPDLAQATQEAMTHRQPWDHTAPEDLPLDLLWVAVNGLTAETAQDIQTLSRQLAARQTWVLHSFGQLGAAARLVSAGVHVHREPLNDQALTNLLQSAVRQAEVPQTAPAGWVEIPNMPAPPRQFSDLVLQRVANIPNQVLCECPRHVAELIGQLARFEDYSRDCLNQGPQDAALHTRLHQMAASARALFEQALQMVASHEGISLEEGN